MSRPRIILASASPRRADLLRSLGLDFEIRPPDVDESIHDGEQPERYVRRIAEAKVDTASDQNLAVQNLAARLDGQPPALIIAADTTVACEGEILGKPTDRDDARRMLRSLSGRSHLVFTGVAVRFGAQRATDVVRTQVDFVAMTDADIAWYLATGEPDDKAGAYGMQGTGNVFVAGVHGSPSNVIGLPLDSLVRLARSIGVDLLAPAPDVSR